MLDYEPYQIVEKNKIVPLYKRGWVKDQPKTKYFSGALEFFLRAGLVDAGVSRKDQDWVELVRAELPQLFQHRYINPEEALFILSGVSPTYAAYRFYWKKKVYFTMRPDFGLLCILTNFNEPPINAYESKIYDGLLDWGGEIEAIYRAILSKELFQQPDFTSPFEDWITFCRSRRFDITHIPEHYLVNTESSLSPPLPPINPYEPHDDRTKASSIKREYQKIKTQERHERWHKLYRSLKTKNPDKSDIWIAIQISKKDVAEGRKVDTIRRNMK